MEAKQRQNRSYAVRVGEFSEPIYLKAERPRDLMFEFRRWISFHKITVTFLGWTEIPRCPTVDNIPTSWTS